MLLSNKSRSHLHQISFACRFDRHTIHQFAQNAHLDYEYSRPCNMSALRPGTGSQRRGLSRDLSKIPLDLQQSLEGIEVLHDIRDQRAIERAVSGVDAVVSAVAAVPDMITETQLLLLRAAEAAVVKVSVLLAR